MPYYRLYCLDTRGHIFRCDDFDAASDEAAIKHALAIRGSQASELWQQERRVHVFQVKYTTATQS